ncbi:DUF1672 family protein [Bacillaceae bacterium Marseille-Q3522]|nr:DUF1672 family protein [Bacillaceae bacterium Marseille-Q3522]
MLFYILSLDDAFDTLFTTYINNPGTTKEEWKQIFKKDSFERRGIIITIDLFMADSNTEPDKNIFNKIVTDIKNMEGLPRGSYSVLLNDNFIDKISVLSTKDNTLERSNPNYIIKQ